MIKIFIILPFCLLLILVLPHPMSAQISPDPELLTEILKIKVIDNHAHPLRVVSEGELPDTDFDVVSSQVIEHALTPFRWRQLSELLPAWRGLYGYPHGDLTEEHKKELVEMRKQTRHQHGGSYPAWVLDKLGIETMLANRVALGRGLQPPRFRWVSFVDALMFPLNNEEAKKTNPDHGILYSNHEQILRRYLKDLQLSTLPPTLDRYLAKIVTPTLERQKLNGAVAVKFVAAYLRTLDFSNASEVQAKRIYAHYVKGRRPPANEYKVMQDYLFRYIAREAGRLGLAVHIHTGFGPNAYFNVDGSRPLLLESAFNDKTLRKTNFVLIHGGWPFAKQTPAMLLKPNVYADFSFMALHIYPRELSEVIHSWLEIAPEKVLFGTDAFEVGSEIVGWEEFGWMGINGSRQALALALTGMMNDGEITREQALGIARKVLRENAIKLYKLNGS